MLTVLRLGTLFPSLSKARVGCLSSLRTPLSEPAHLCCHLRGISKSRHYLDDKDKPISDTSIMVQDGLYIMELPSIVQIINGSYCDVNGNIKGVGKIESEMNSEEVPKSVFKNIDFEEESEMILGFVRCSYVGEIFLLLDTCPEEEVTSSVALAVIKRILELENNTEFRNEGVDQYPRDSPLSFTRAAVMKRLIETVCNSPDPQIIIDTLRTMVRDNHKGDTKCYLERLCNECIILTTEGKLTVTQICEAARAFHSLGNIGSSYIEKVWVGLVDKKGEINEEETCILMSILPLIRHSRKLVYNILEKRMSYIWFKLKPEHIIRILHVMVQLGINSNRMLALLSRWTNVSSHLMSEGNLRWVVYSFMCLDYCDDNIQKTLCRFLKIKKTNICDASLVAVTMEYASKMRIRHATMLDGAAEYFVAKADSLSVPQIASIVQAYGFLNYDPPNTQAFFEAFEVQLENKFAQFPPNIILDLFLSCVYLKKFPLNFVKKVFSPYFFDRIHVLSESDMQTCRMKLKMLDTALTLEAPNYHGPLLPKDFSSSGFLRDSRIHRCLKDIHGLLIEVAGSAEQIALSSLVPILPGSQLYIIDAIIDMSRKMNLAKLSWGNEKYAVLIHLPEHFDVAGKILTGPQAMKTRHLQAVGFKVVHLEYQELGRLRMFPDMAKSYIIQHMKNV